MENNKKIGIVTFHMADNYGAVLQAYALQHYIESHISKNVEIVDYETEEHLKAYNIFNFNSKKWYVNMLFNLFSAIHYLPLKKRKKSFALFRDQYLHRTKEKYRTEHQLSMISGKDVYITGSDQVFNPRLSDWKAYYLNFNKGRAKKLAYAPSFGTSNFNDEITHRILPYLKDFNAISCREKSGSEYLERILHHEVPTVVDPTFLLSKEEWNKIAICPNRKRKFLFVYSLNGGTKLKKLAENVAEEEGLEIVTLGGVKPFSGRNNTLSLGPREFVGHIIEANFVVTDSFHGTAFSLICKKRHLSYIAFKEKGARIETIMQAYGKSDEIVYDVSRYLHKKGNIHPTNQIPDELIRISEDFLIHNILN